MNRIDRLVNPLVVLCSLAALISQSLADGVDPAATLPLESRADAAVTAVLGRTGVPSASIALVRNSAIIYAQAYGRAQLSSQRLAKPEMRYAVGSISK